MGRTSAVDRRFPTPHPGQTSVSLHENTNCHTHTFIAENTSHVVYLYIIYSGVGIAQSLHKLGYGLDDRGIGGLIPGRGK
jgi:hypothetical protein